MISINPEEVRRSKKLKCVLSKLLEKDLVLSDYTLLEKLYSVLQQQFKESGDDKKAADLGLFVPWLCMVSKKWKILTKGVKVFAFRIAALTAQVKPGLKTIVDCGLMKCFCSVVKGDAYDPFILLGYCEFLLSVIDQDPTCKAIMDFGLWRDVIHISLNSRSVYTSRKGRQCVSLLLTSLSKCHSSDFSFPIMDAMVRPLSHGTFSVVPLAETSTPDSLALPLFPNFPPSSRDILAAIALATEVMAEMMKAKVPQTKISELISPYKINEWAWNVIEVENENIELIEALSRLLAHVNSTTIAKLDSGEVEYKCMRALTLLALHHCQLLAQKHLFSLVLDCCIDYQTLWARHGGPIAYSEEDLQQETFEIENNLIITQCMPLYICMKVTRVMESDVMDMFAEKVFSLSCKETQRVCYIYRDCLREATDRSIEALCLQGIRSFLRIPTFCSKREQAVMSFQCMMHTLKEFVPDEVSDISADCIVARKHPGENLVSRYPTILSAILDGLVKFIPEFHITWRDSLETICILTFIQGLVNNSAISPMLCAKALQLARLVISEFIPPNLALLVDTLEGSSMENLGKLLYKKANDIHWEVRDSALEVISAVSEIAQAKFPSFQSLLLDNQLPDLTVSLMSTDPNSYVRASAVSCLQLMVKIQNIWDSSLYAVKLVDQVLKCLVDDPEGIVRHQAALLINDIYNHQIIPGPQMERLLDTMSYIAIKDLHWETRVGCLEFWISVISKAKSKEGMIDGEFPTVTFSSVKKKIITLDPPEIRIHLANILNILGNTGCLYVLWECLNEDCDLEVTAKAKEIIADLMALLDKYEFLKYYSKATTSNHTKPVLNVDLRNNQDCHSSNNCENKQNSVKNDLPVPESRTADEVIEEIVGTEDAALIAALAAVGVSGTNSGHSDSSSNRKTITPRTILQDSDFLRLAEKIDPSSLVFARAKWLRDTTRGIDSVLDDILAHSVDADFNLIDCY